MADFENEEVKGELSQRLFAAAYVQSIFQFFRQTELYDPKNAIFDRCLEEILRLLESFMAQPGQAGLELSFRAEQVYVNSQRIKPNPKQFHIYKHLLKFLKKRKIGGFRILSLPKIDDLRNFFWAIAKIDRDEPFPVQSISEFLKAQGIDVFEVLKLTGGTLRPDGKTDGDAGDVEFIVAAFYERLRRFVEVALDNLEKASEFSLKPVQHTLNEVVLLAEEDIVQMLRLVSVKRYDRPLPYRAANACFLILSWGRAFRLPNSVLTEMAGAAFAHPLSLKNDGGLPQTADEIGEVQERIARLKSVWPLSELQKLSLMEWTQPWGKDGVYEVGGVKCYPHFLSRMIRIVALFEAMTTYEPGKRTYLPDEAIAELLRQQHLCDPTLLKLFVNWIGVYPVGSFVILQSGELGQVFAAAADPLRFQRPLVSLLKDPQGNLLPRPQIVDLSEMNEKLGVYKRSIRKSVSFEEANVPREILQLPPVDLAS